MHKHILCTLPNASCLISGIDFAESTDPKGMLSVGPVDDETAEAFAAIPGYAIHEVAAPSHKRMAPPKAEKKSVPVPAEAPAAGEAPQDPAAGEGQAPTDPAAGASADGAGETGEGSQEPSGAGEAADAAAAETTAEQAAAESPPATETKAEAAPAAEAKETAAPEKSGGKPKGSK